MCSPSVGVNPNSILPSASIRALMLPIATPSTSTGCCQPALVLNVGGEIAACGQHALSVGGLPAELGTAIGKTAATIRPAYSSLCAVALDRSSATALVTIAAASTARAMVRRVEFGIGDSLCCRGDASDRAAQFQHPASSSSCQSAADSLLRRLSVAPSMIRSSRLNIWASSSVAVKTGTSSRS